MLLECPALVDLRQEFSLLVTDCSGAVTTRVLTFYNQFSPRATGMIHLRRLRYLVESTGGSIHFDSDCSPLSAGTS